MHRSATLPRASLAEPRVAPSSMQTVDEATVLAYVSSRAGSVLGKGTILKDDRLPVGTHASGESRPMKDRAVLKTVIIVLYGVSVGHFVTRSAIFISDWVQEIPPPPRCPLCRVRSI